MLHSIWFKLWLSAGFNCLAPRGTLVIFGGASGYPDSLDLNLLLSGSRGVIHTALFDYIATPEELNERANAVFNWITQGKIKMDSFTVLALSEAKKAHEVLEGKKTTGKLLLKPWSVFLKYSWIEKEAMLKGTDFGFSWNCLAHRYKQLLLYKRLWSLRNTLRS